MIIELRLTFDTNSIVAFVIGCRRSLGIEYSNISLHVLNDDVHHAAAKALRGNYTPASDEKLASDRSHGKKL